MVWKIQLWVNARKSPSGVLRLLRVRMYLRISLYPFVVL
jgi:hypothetical protein